MSFFGTWALLLALASSLYAGVAGAVAARGYRRRLAQSARGAMLGTAVATTVAVVVLLYLLVESDFRVAYVADYTSLSLALPYKLSALWAGLAGSSLFWSWILSLYAAYLVLRPAEGGWRLHTYALAILGGLEAFFHLFTIAYAMPFIPMASVPLDGLGLNPLLQNPGMIVHPPALYLGYVGMAIPFAYGMAALLARVPGSTWLALVRRWTMVAWLFLSFGIVFGGQWAYGELGWGGYWAWDPVENASFLPWLTATAFLHSSLIQKRTGNFKLWNMVLVSVTFLLVILGVFITKSGVVSSIHAFSGAPGGPLLLVFLGVVTLFAGGVIVGSLPLLRDEGQVDRLFSRAGFFAILNLLFLAWAGLILLGTVFPLLTRLTSGRTLTVGSGYYDTVTVPIVVALVVLLGLSQAVRWGRGEWRDLWHQEGRGFDLSRYGSPLVHLGVLLIVVGVVASTVYSSSRFVVLRPGQATRVGAYSLRYQGLYTQKVGQESLLFGKVLVRNKGRVAGSLEPGLEFWPEIPQPFARVAIRSNWKEDLYVILAGYQGQVVTLQVLTEPLVAWIWAGLWVLVAGGLLSLGQRSAPSQPLPGGDGR